MHSYYFVKYNDQTSLNHLIKYAETDSIICFDFEDSVQSSQQKKNCRIQFKRILDELIPQLSNFNIGLRVNSIQTELTQDLNLIKGKKLCSILVPKVESLNRLLLIKQKLDSNKTCYEEIVPIIESKVGLNNLESIINQLPKKIEKIGFGHCDYNLNINRIPFFHQDTKQYWRWINKFAAVMVPNKLAFINSAYLHFDNLRFFNANLEKLYSVFGDNCGQFALTSKQAIAISKFVPRESKINFDTLLLDCYDLKIPGDYAENLISDYECDNKNMSFTISQYQKKLISPQEYLLAKKFISRKEKQEFNLTFVGGCFPVQYNILFEDLFHQKLKSIIEKSSDFLCNINIIRYERFLTCLDKIILYNNKNPIDLLIFHIRPEPFLRLIKFYYRYVNTKGKIRHSLNVPLFKLFRPESHDILILGRRFSFLTSTNKSVVRKFFANLNYHLGIRLGNRRFSAKKYYQLTRSIIEYCDYNNIELIILGPAYRDEIKIEPNLCEYLNNYMKDRLKEQMVNYIDGLFRDSEIGEPFFNKNGIHASEKYHEFIANKLYDIIKSKMHILTMPNNEYNQ
jgi:citrate lyase beta subunit